MVVVWSLYSFSASYLPSSRILTYSSLDYIRTNRSASSPQSTNTSSRNHYGYKVIVFHCKQLFTNKQLHEKPLKERPLEKKMVL